MIITDYNRNSGVQNVPHTDGNNPSQQLRLTSVTLVEKEAPEVGVGCAGPCLNEQNGVQAGG